MVGISWASYGQEGSRNITGTVKSAEDGSAVPGVNVVIKGTSTGAITDIDGNYSVNVSGNNTILVFSFVGLETQEVQVGARSVIDVAMTSDVKQLDEIVVTAQGIQRKKEALGFAVSTIDSDEVANKTESDIGRALRSKASGVQITQQSGLSGSGTNIVIRGLSSVTGNNQPLFIIDGVPFNTNTNQSDGATTDGNEFVDGGLGGGSRFSDFDPSNVEEIQVLKGLAAATLYGSAGRNGVILITTKSGGSGGTNNKGLEFSVTQSVFANQIASLADYQDSFGNGFDQVFGFFFSNWGPSFNRDGLAGFSSDATVDDNGNIPHPYSQFSNPALRAAFPQFQQGTPGFDYAWRPYNNVEDFFRTGVVANTSLNVRGGDANNSYNVNFGYLNDEGFTPGNNLERISLSVGGSSKFSNGFRVNGTMNLSRTDFTSPPIAASQGNGSFGAGSSVFGHLFFTPRSIDLLNLPFQNPIDGSSVYYRNGNDIQNPLWTANNAFNSQLTNRVYGTLGAIYDINDNLNVAYRIGYDIYNELNESGQNKGGVEGPLTGQYRSFNNLSTIWDHTLTLNGNYDLSEQFALSFNVGATSRRTVLDRQGVTSNNQLVFGIFRHFNFTQQAPIQFLEEQNILGFFGQAEVNYNGYVFLTLAGRNDAVSNFTKENRSLFYPSVSTSVLLSEIFPEITNSSLLSVLKLRGGFGTSAGFAPGFPVSRTLNLVPRNFVDGNGTVTASNTTGALLANPDLRPERQEEIEVGVEAVALSDRLTLDLSLYRRVSRDQIVNRPLDPSTGFTSTTVNLGQVNTKGLEIDLGIDVFRNSLVSWNTKLNFTSFQSEVIDLGNDTDQIAIAGFTNLGNFAVEGQPLGVIQGSRILRNDDGEAIINSNGRYTEEEGTFVIGNPIPDFTLNSINTVNYKNFSFSAVINYVQGGDIYSSTVATLLGRGLTTDTEDRVNTFILDGVRNIGTADAPNFVPNDLQINNSSFYFNNVLFGPDELVIYDATTIRLQEISLTYSLPKGILSKTPFGSASLTFSGYNLWYRAVNVPPGTNFDPNVAGLGVGNGQGFDFLSGPSSKRFGGTLKFTF